MTEAQKIFEYVKENIRDMYSVSVWENGQVSSLQVMPANKTNNIYSVSKLFTVTALGFLYDEGKFLPSEKIVDIFADELIPDMDPKWKDVTADMVMRHRYGIAQGFLDIDVEDINNYEKVYGTRNDFLRIIFSAKLPLALDGPSQYSDAAYYLLSRVVEKKSGMDLQDYLRVKLFNPMEFEEFAWSRCPMGYSMGATGLYLRCTDMLKLGKLYLNKGIYEGTRLLSEQWCDLTLERSYELASVHGGYAKGGMGGQFLYVNYRRSIVVAWMGYEVEGYSQKMGNLLDRLYNSESDT